MAVSKKTQALIDQAVADAIKATQAGLVAAQSKPELVKDLRATWRKDAVHVAEQVKRFLRLSVLAAMPTLLPLLMGGHFDSKTLLAFLVPVLEVVYRQMFPALGAQQVDDAQGVTIVPSQVGAQTVDVAVDSAQVEVALPDDTSAGEAAAVAADVEGDAAP